MPTREDVAHACTGFHYRLLAEVTRTPTSIQIRDHLTGVAITFHHGGCTHHYKGTSQTLDLVNARDIACAIMGFRRPYPTDVWSQVGNLP